MRQSLYGMRALAVLRERYAGGEIGRDESGCYPGWGIRTGPDQRPGTAGGRD